jgi:hypothetical protein
LDKSRIVINEKTIAQFLAENPPVDAQPLKLRLDDVDLTQTGVLDGDLRFFGIDVIDFRFIAVNVGNIDITAAERASFTIEEIILARTLSYVMLER